MFSKYVLILLWIGFMALISRSQYREEYDKLTSKYVWRVKPFFAFIIVIPIVWMAANRGFFADSSLYIRTYLSMPSIFDQIPRYMSNVKKDPAFYYVASVIHVLFGNNYIIYFFLIALFQMICVSTYFRRYSTNYIFSLFLFVASADYISFIFNGMRQFVAVAICLLSTPFVLNKKYIKAIIVILIASTFHRSALIMVPFIFITQGEVWNKKTILVLFATVIAMVFTSSFTNTLDLALEGTQYENVVSDYTKWGDDGTNPIRVLVYSIPAIWSYFYRDKIRKYNDPVITLAVNMSIVTMAVYLISMVTSGLFIGRLPIYFCLFGYILLPWEIENLTGESREFIHFAAVFMYLLYYFFIMHFQNALI